MSSNFCDWSMLMALPDDLFAIITRSLSPKDICNLSLCCRSLNALAASDKVWLNQCEMVGIVSCRDLVEWHRVVMSYKLLCKFLVGVRPLVGVWVHQNPELGNVVYVMPGFVSVVGCRVIPQELGPLGIDDGPLLWAPVFEIVADDDGSAVFFLHGREKDCDYVYPGSVKSIDKSCNVLLLEVEPRKLMKNLEEDAHCRSFHYVESVNGREVSNGLEDLVPKRSFSQYFDDEQGRKVSRSDKGASKSQRLPEQNHMTVPFSKLSFGDRRKLLEIVTCQVRLGVPNPADSPLFPCLREDEVRFKKEIMHLSERRALLINMHKFERERLSWTDSHEIPSLPAQLDLNEIKKILDRSSGFRNSLSGDDTRSQSARRRSLSECLRNSIKQMLRRSNSVNRVRGLATNGSSSTESKHAHLHEFLRSGDTVGLTLHASTMKLSSYRAWPNMHDSRFALYKLPIREPTPGQEYAGLWGGTFGWPPGKPSEDKPGKALFFLALSYHDELPGKRLLIATKILEGTHYVLHPNGSAMFVVNFDEPSVDPFPWTSGADALPVDIKCAFTGEGIANGYGFRYPGSKPGSLFELQDGILAFLWKESGAILTLRRLNLQELLRKGEQVPALPPIANFSYLTKSYSNVFAGFANTATSLSSPGEVQS